MVYAWDSSNVSFSGNTTFQRAEEDGGRIFAEDNSDVNFSGACTISENIAEHGGGIYLESSVINFSGYHSQKQYSSKTWRMDVHDHI